MIIKSKPIYTSGNEMFFEIKAVPVHTPSEKVNNGNNYIEDFPARLTTISFNEDFIVNEPYLKLESKYIFGAV